MAHSADEQTVLTDVTARPDVAALGQSGFEPGDVIS
jgi:hypothetical protein